MREALSDVRHFNQFGIRFLFGTNMGIFANVKWQRDKYSTTSSDGGFGKSKFDYFLAALKFSSMHETVKKTLTSC